MPKAKKKAQVDLHDFENLPTHLMVQEVRRRQRLAGTLQKRREALVAKLDELDGQIAMLVGRGTAASPTRADGTSLVGTLHQVMAGQGAVSVEAATELVLQAGYRSTSSNFRTIVNQALVKNPEKFRKVSRGVYTVVK